MTTSFREKHLLNWPVFWACAQVETLQTWFCYFAVCLFLAFTLSSWNFLLWRRL